MDDFEDAEGEEGLEEPGRDGFPVSGVVWEKKAASLRWGGGRQCCRAGVHWDEAPSFPRLWGRR